MKRPHLPSISWSGFVERIGLHRPELRAWALYDWANSAVVTVIIAAVFPIYFNRVAGAILPDDVATQRYAIVSVILFFLLGGLVLSRVDVAEGRRAVEK